MSTSLVKTVAAYADESGKIHSSKIDALRANQVFALRGVVQTALRCGPNQTTFTMNDIVGLVKNHSKDLVAAVNRYNRAIAKEQANLNPVENS